MTPEFAADKTEIEALLKDKLRTLENKYGVEVAAINLIHIPPYSTDTRVEVGLIKVSLDVRIR